jgi:hypothetical protein
LLGGVCAVIGGLVAASEHLDSLAIAEWSVVGLIGPPAFVCVVIFGWIWWCTPTKQRNEARATLMKKDAQVGELLVRVAVLTTERTEALARAEDAEARAKPQIGQYVDKLFEVNLPDNPVAAEAALKQLPLLGTRFTDETKLPGFMPESSDTPPTRAANPQAADSAADDEADGVVQP